MADQGGSGGIESHMPTHRRQDSAAAEEPIPAETTAETRQSETSTEQNNLSQQPQDLPRGSISAQSNAVGTEVDEATPGSGSELGAGGREDTRSTVPILLAESDASPSPLTVSSTPLLVATPPPSTSRHLEPPVTKQTLSELDVNKIVHNPKLRHDINFDPELHFRPNLDGERGRRKQQRADQFWATLKEQLVLFMTNRAEFDRLYRRNNSWCLPNLLSAVRDIVQTLVPARDRDLLSEALNVDHFMQQFNHGVADLEKLASSLANVLKQHCAPMRDDWVDEMYRQLSDGASRNDIDLLIKGMRSLLAVLEAMKLDVANHQIRCLRPVLINDTINFEQRFFERRIQSGRFDVSRARAWYAEARLHDRLSQAPPLPELGDTSVFFGAFVKLLMPSTSTQGFPSTFLFDEDRIIKLRSDVYDSIALEVCMRRFDELERLSENLAHMNRRLSPGFSSEGSDRSSRSSMDLHNTPASTRPSSFVYSDNGSATSSPRNSGLFGTRPSGLQPGNRSRTKQLYDDLLGLLHTAPATNVPSQRWQSLAPAAALQVLRSVDSPIISSADPQLVEYLTNIEHPFFRDAEEQLQRQLLGLTARYVGDFRNLAGVELFSAVSHQQGRLGQWTQARSRSPRPRGHRLLDGTTGSIDLRQDAGIPDMALRVAHVGVLHWRVWAPILYAPPPVADADTDSPMT